MIVREFVRIGDKVVSLETGRIAKQAGGSVLVTCEETVVLVTVCGNQDSKPGQDFLPLSVEYIEKTYATGKIPGGFFKREGKLRDDEILVSRLIDRPCRPLFPEGWFGDIQVVATVLSHDRTNPSDVLAMIGASAAIHLSPIPWAGPIAGVRVGRVEGQFIANPTIEQMAQSDCEFVIAASKDAIMMVEGEAKEISETDMLAALQFGHNAIQGVIRLIERMRDIVGKAKWEFTLPSSNQAIEARVREVALAGIKEACNIREKHDRYNLFKKIKKDTVTALSIEFPDQQKAITEAYEELRYQTMRNQVVHEKTRVDGRDLVTVRPITIETSVLPRVHGSSLFTRGETQAIVTCTLGTKQDEQRIDGLTSESWKRFMLHYNFPAYSVGETKPMRGPGRREIGHGNLAERALKQLMPSHEEFPYTIRIVSEITESNGSSSMASVCGGSLALMDAGVPLKEPVAGVAMGLIMQGQDYSVLTDILGDEDALGDMDFKVCGTQKGITAIQMDIKIQGLSSAIMAEALEQARQGRLFILEKMIAILESARPELSTHAPRITQIKVKPDQIRTIIGPGGKMIKAIVDQTGVKIDVADDGTVSISSADAAAVKKAIGIIESLTNEPEVGTKYKGIVRRIERYGAFLEIAPGTDGLLHITDMDWGFVENVENLMKIGDEVEVVVTNIDREGRIRLSRKALIDRPADGAGEEPNREQHKPERSQPSQLNHEKKDMGREKRERDGAEREKREVDYDKRDRDIAEREKREVERRARREERRPSEPAMPLEKPRARMGQAIKEEIVGYEPLRPRDTLQLRRPISPERSMRSQEAPLTPGRSSEIERTSERTSARRYEEPRGEQRTQHGYDDGRTVERTLPRSQPNQRTAERTPMRSAESDRGPRREAPQREENFRGPQGPRRPQPQPARREEHLERPIAAPLSHEDRLARLERLRAANRPSTRLQSGSQRQEEIAPPVSARRDSPRGDHLKRDHLSYERDEAQSPRPPRTRRSRYQDVDGDES